MLNGPPFPETFPDFGFQALSAKLKSPAIDLCFHSNYSFSENSDAIVETKKKTLSLNELSFA